MIVGSYRFYHTMMLQYVTNIRNCNPVELAIKSAQIKATQTVKLTGITLGNILNF